METLPTKESFAEQSDTNFQAETKEGTSFEMTLVEIKTVVSNKIQECFSLLFRTTANDAPAFQQLFRVKHAALGEMTLFLVPVKKNENGLFFEAVFNKLLA